MPYPDSMESLGDFREFVCSVRNDYRDEISCNGNSPLYIAAIERSLADFNKRADRVFDLAGHDTPHNTPLDGEALEQAKHMLLLGR